MHILKLLVTKSCECTMHTRIHAILDMQEHLLRNEYSDTILPKFLIMQRDISTPTRLQRNIPYE